MYLPSSDLSTPKLSASCMHKAFLPSQDWKGDPGPSPADPLDNEETAEFPPPSLPQPRVSETLFWATVSSDVFTRPNGQTHFVSLSSWPEGIQL